MYRFTVSKDGLSFNCRPHEQDIKEAMVSGSCPCCGRKDVNQSRFDNRPMIV
jgi:Zn finger protein HypA/HybF involved in hydrogenase expression